MKDPYLLHIFNPTKNVSPFDVNMAYEAEFDGVIPYSNVTLEEVHALTQDTIFSRGPSGARRTGIFIGGREFGLAMDMLNRARSAMVPPFEVSVFADPSGAVTTAAAMVACTEHQLRHQTGEEMSGKQVYILGGTGPVGICAGVLAHHCGANVYLVSHRGKEVAAAAAREYNGRFGVDMQAVGSGNDEEMQTLMRDAQILFGAAKAGVRVVHHAELAMADRLLVAADVNAVPPSGIEGVEVNDMGKVLEGTPGKATGIGALAIGDVKYKVHRRLFEIMKEHKERRYLDHMEAFAVAREILGK
jgi:methylene-tetrahydromethanopterin dehydrogenase